MQRTIYVEQKIYNHVAGNEIEEKYKMKLALKLARKLIDEKLIIYENRADPLSMADDVVAKVTVVDNFANNPLVQFYRNGTAIAADATLTGTSGNFKLNP